MTDEQYQTFVDNCYAELEPKQQVLFDQYGLGKVGLRIELDFDNEMILFYEDCELRVTAHIIPIGSFHEDSGSWMWGWANDVFGESLQYKSSRLMNLARSTDRKQFITEIIPADADMVWELAAIGVQHLAADACYRVPSGVTKYFYALNNIQIKKS